MDRALESDANVFWDGNEGILVFTSWKCKMDKWACDYMVLEDLAEMLGHCYGEIW